MYQKHAASEAPDAKRRVMGRSILKIKKNLDRDKLGYVVIFFYVIIAK
jgi:hypothetical protein